MLALPMESQLLWPAAKEAASMVDDGAVVGLGTGRAAAMFVRALGHRVHEGLAVRSVPTSSATESLALELGIPLVSLDEVESIDIDVDGADEVDPSLDLIKGHGGALVRERVVASIARRLVILVGEEKLVSRLGERMSIPVEVVPFATPTVQPALESLGAEVTRRRTPSGETFISDNGNVILDARFQTMKDARDVARRIDAIPGVVDNGLFLGMADLVLVHDETADPDGFRRLERS